MTENGLKDLFSVEYAENIVTHKFSGEAIASAIRAHTLVEFGIACSDCSGYIWYQPTWL